jgi:hypothetical protein
VEIVPALILAGVAVVVGGLTSLARRSEHRDAEHPERVRMPRVVLWVGIGGVPPMLLILLAAPGSGDPAMTIVPLLLIGVFAYLLLLYANWYLVVGPSRLTFRTALGRVRTIRYEDITRARLVRRYGTTRLDVRDSGGTRFSVNPGTFDVGPLLKSLHERDFELAARPG